jgi:hypothetical protein
MAVLSENQHLRLSALVSLAQAVEPKYSRPRC